MAKRQPKQLISSVLIKKYLLNKLSIPVNDHTKDIDKNIKKVNKLSKPDEIERAIKNIDFQIKNCFKK